jgi:alkylated DNA repair dioxygenase AlkB
LRERVLVDERGCFVAYYENFLSLETQEALFENLRDTLDWNVETDDFGPQDRKSYYMADDDCIFKYVGLKLEPNPWVQQVREVKEQANESFRTIVAKRLSLEEGPDQNVTACLVNNYEEGGSFIPWHFDEVRAHGQAKLVLSVSLGGTRTFELQRADVHADNCAEQSQAEEKVEVGVEGGRKSVLSKGAKISLKLAPGSALLMAGMQLSPQNELLEP